MKAFGIEDRGQLLGTGNNTQIQETFTFQKPLWKVTVRCEPRKSAFWPRAYVNLSIRLNGTWTSADVERVIVPSCDLRENSKELETFVRSWLDDVSLQLTEVYRAFPEEENPDPKEITLFGVKCKQEGDDRSYTGHDHLENQGISVQVLIEPMEHTVSSSHVVTAEAEFTYNNVRVVVEDESNLDEVEGRMKEKLHRAYTTLRVNYLVDLTQDPNEEE